MTPRRPAPSSGVPASDLPAEVRRGIELAGYYPALVEQVVATAVAGEAVHAHLVHQETTFDAQEVRSHVTVLVVTPTRLVTAHVDDQRWVEFGPGAVGVGWDGLLLGLATHLATGATNNPAESMAWMVSDEGREFMTASSELWFEASVAAGTPEAEARAAADRTTAAYTAVPE